MGRAAAAAFAKDEEGAGANGRDRQLVPSDAVAQADTAVTLAGCVAITTIPPTPQSTSCHTHARTHASDSLARSRRARACRNGRANQGHQQCASPRQPPPAVTPLPATTSLALLQPDGQVERGLGDAVTPVGGVCGSPGAAACTECENGACRMLHWARTRHMQLHSHQLTSSMQPHLPCALQRKRLRGGPWSAYASATTSLLFAAPALVFAFAAACVRNAVGWGVSAANERASSAAGTGQGRARGRHAAPLRTLHVRTSATPPPLLLRVSQWPDDNSHS
jgi:hypothetical protein